jgi:hypothetical protein
MNTSVVKKALGILLATVASASGYAGDFPLVSNGKAPAEIIIDAKAPAMVRHAAREMGDYLFKISGSRPALVEAGPDWTLPSDTERRIFIGESAFTRKQGFAPDALKPDGFLVGADAHNLLLVGRDEPVPYVENKTAVTGLGFEDLYVNRESGLCAYGQTGSLFAVYQILEKVGGVRWIWPGALGEEVPSAQNLTVPEGRRTVEPEFALRQYSGFRFDQDQSASQWYRRAGFGGTTDPLWPNHSAALIYGNPENHKNHPEWFALVNGARSQVDLCWTEPTLVDEWVRLANEYFTKFPDAKMFRVVPEDGSGTCECARCQSRIDQSPPHIGDGPIGGNALLGNLYFPTVNEVARRLAVSHPDKLVGALAYSTYLKAPYLLEKLEPNVRLMFCAMTPTMWAGSGYFEPIAQFEKTWLAKGAKSFAVWDYMNPHLFVTGGNNGLYTPYVIPHLLGRRYSRLKDVANGAFIEAENYSPELVKLSHYGMDHVNWYVLGKLTWDPAADVDAILKDYSEKFFGPSATAMRRFWDIQEAALTNRRDLIQWDESPTRWNHAYNPDVLRRMFAALDEARRIAQEKGEERHRQRIDLIAGEYAILRSCLVDHWKPDPKLLDSVPNGSFEKKKDGKPVDWETTPGVALASSPVLSGKTSLRLEGAEAMAISSPISLMPGRDYRFSVWFKTEGNGDPDAPGARPRLSVLGGDSSPSHPTWRGDGIAGIALAPAVSSSIARPGNDPDWQRLYVISRPGPEARIRLQGAKGYTVWFDDATVELLPEGWQSKAYGIPNYPAQN